MNNLKARRMELGLSQPDVVKAVRETCPIVDVSLYSKIENGHCLPNTETLAALEIALQAHRTELFETDDLVQMLPDEDYLGPSRGQRPELGTVAMLIPFGRENAIPREVLAAKLHTTDRQARRMVEEARQAGLIILNGQDGRGYYQSADLKEMRSQYKQDTARAMSILKRRKPLRDALKAAGEQV